MVFGHNAQGSTGISVRDGLFDLSSEGSVHPVATPECSDYKKPRALRDVRLARPPRLSTSRSQSRRVPHANLPVNT